VVILSILWTERESGGRVVERQEEMLWQRSGGEAKAQMMQRAGENSRRLEWKRRWLVAGNLAVYPIGPK